MLLYIAEKAKTEIQGILSLFQYQLMPGQHRTPEGLGTDIRPTNGQTRGYSGIEPQGHMLLTRRSQVTP